jgi:hypothetical protein
MIDPISLLLAAILYLVKGTLAFFAMWVIRPVFVAVVVWFLLRERSLPAALRVLLFVFVAWFVWDVFSIGLA